MIQALFYISKTSWLCLMNEMRLVYELDCIFAQKSVYYRRCLLKNIGINNEMIIVLFERGLYK